MTYKKKLIEVALPLEAINIASAREKSIRHGHPSTLHLWWARRPLAACRAVLFSSLVDDPSARPEEFPTEADQERERQRLFRIIEDLVLWENSNNPAVLDAAKAEIRKSCLPPKPPDTDDFDTIIVEEASKFNGYKAFGDDEAVEIGKRIAAEYGRTDRWSGTINELRCALFWQNRMGHWDDFDVSHDAIKELYHEIRRRWDEVEPDIPPVLDPFCGGGSIPLEAQRLGLEAHGSDLNPVAVLITKALIEIPPKFAGQPPINPEARRRGADSGSWKGAAGLAEDVRYYGKWMRDEAEKRIGHLYPKAVVWTNPATGAIFTQQEYDEILVQERTLIPDPTSLLPHPSSLERQELTVIAWLWARTVKCPNPACGVKMPLVRSFVLSSKKGKETWASPRLITNGERRIGFSIQTKGSPADGTVSRRGATCVGCGSPVALDYVRSEGKAKRMGAQLMAIVAEGKRGRMYLPPISDHESSAAESEPAWLPEGDLVANSRHMTPVIYGMTKWADLFTKRQLVALTTFSDLVRDIRRTVAGDIADAGTRLIQQPDDYASAVATYLALAVSRLTDISNALCTWENTKTQVRHLFTRQAVPMLWDFAEANIFGGAAGDYAVTLSNLLKALLATPSRGTGCAVQRDATAASSVTGPLICTDPPYYDNVPYADLSDFFYVWLRRNLLPVYPDLLSTMLTPKAGELVADPFRQGGREQARRYFERGSGRVFEDIRSLANQRFPVTVFYAFKQTDTGDDADDGAANTGAASTGWETLLEGLIASGHQVTGTWPMRTELANRMRNLDSNALASSIVLVCRARAEDAPIATRREFVQALRTELEEALVLMMHGNIAPVDLAQATIGPGMAVYSRYSKVVESNGSPLGVRTALQIINEELDAILSAQEGDYDSDTRFCIGWFEQKGVSTGMYGDAQTLATARGTTPEAVDRSGCAEATGGKVRLLRYDEYPADWDPAADARRPVWRCTQQLIRAMETGGDESAARLSAQLGAEADTARDLSYRLYSICERKGWAKEALAYNSLVASWSQVQAAAAEMRQTQAVTGVLPGMERE